MKIKQRLQKIRENCVNFRQDLQAIKKAHKIYQTQFQCLRKQLLNFTKNNLSLTDKENNNPNLQTKFSHTLPLKKLAKKIQQEPLSNKILGLASKLAQQEKNREISRPSLLNADKSISAIKKYQIQNKLQNSFYTKRKDDTQSLKSKILQQLAQLKVLEKKEEFLRSTNERMKIYYSESKKNLEKCLSISKQLEKSQCKSKKQALQLNSRKQYKNHETAYNSNYSYQTKLSQKIKFCISENSLIESDISIPVSLKPNSKNSQIDYQQTVSLYCQNNHQYYTGTISSQTKLPQGSGHLFFCCKKMPLLPNFVPTGKKPIIQTLTFYQGNFSNGKFEGLGTLGYKGKDDIKFVGEFHNNLRNGKGSLYCGGRAEIGIWKSDVFVSLI